MTVHIIGAGLSGLASAFYLLEKTKNKKIIVYEATSQAQGRCASYFDKTLDAKIDNGTHLMLGANKTLLFMLEKCQTKTPLKKIGNDFLFYQRNQEPFKISTKSPLSALPHLKKIYPLLIESLLNTPFKQADKIMGLKTLLQCMGKKNGHVLLANPSLKDSVITPIVQYLQKNNVEFRLAHRLKSLNENQLVFFNETLPLEKKDKVILAVDAKNLKVLLPSLSEKNFPTPSFQAIVGVHYKLKTTLPQNSAFIGLVGCIGHWIFIKNNIVSVTISAANKLIETNTPDEIASKVWIEINDILNLSLPLPVYRVIIEKRATPLQTKHTNKTRLKTTQSGLNNLFLAGDFIKTNLPCTIEGALLSGKNAANAVLKTLKEEEK